MALASTSQSDFSAGIFRGRKAPPASVYDAVDALVDDEGNLIRRGGGVYLTTSNVVSGSNRLVGLVDSYTYAGQRTLTWGDDGNIYVLAADDLTGIAIGGVASSSWPLPFARPVGVNGVLAFPRNGSALLYAGSRKAAYITGTASVTNGSATVTGAGTLWLANVEKGSFIVTASGRGIVSSVDTNTQITLRDVWSGTTAAGAAYSAAPFYTVTPAAVGAAISTVAAVGTSPRLVVCQGNIAAFSNPGDPFTFTTGEYHQLPSDVQILGSTQLDGNLILFTTQGVWAISNMELDPVDAYGNIQHTVQRINGDLVLWGPPPANLASPAPDAGIAFWGGGVIVPAIDDIFLFTPGEAPISISGDPTDTKIRPLYRSYVAAGYYPGAATVHRGHYILPFYNLGSGYPSFTGSGLVDVLVCRLDRGTAWTRWSGFSAALAYATRLSGAASPKLLGVSPLRVQNLTGCMVPTSSNALDADGSAHSCTITTRDFPSGQQPGFFKNARVRYECVDDGSGATAAPTVAIAFTSDQDAGAFSTLTERGAQGGGTGWGVSDGSKYQWALVAKKRERLRLRITVTGACASFVLRSVELLLRQSGKQ